MWFIFLFWVECRYPFQPLRRHPVALLTVMYDYLDIWCEPALVLFDYLICDSALANRLSVLHRFGGHGNFMRRYRLRRELFVR